MNHNDSLTVGKSNNNVAWSCRKRIHAIIVDPSFIGVRTESAHIHIYVTMSVYYFSFEFLCPYLYILKYIEYMCISISESISIYISFVLHLHTFTYPACMRQGIGMVQISSPSGLAYRLCLLLISVNDWIVMLYFWPMGLRASSKSGVSVHPQVLAYLKWHLHVTMTSEQSLPIKMLRPSKNSKTEVWINHSAQMWATRQD